MKLHDVIRVIYRAKGRRWAEFVEFAADCDPNGFIDDIVADGGRIFSVRNAQSAGPFKGWAKQYTV